MTLFLSIILKATIVLAVAAGANLLVRRRTSAAWRHLVWSLAFVALLTLPVLSMTLPVWGVPIRAAAPGARAGVPIVAVGPARVVAGEVMAPRPGAASTPAAPGAPAAPPASGTAWWIAALPALYVIGVSCLLLRIVIERWIVRRLSRSAREVSDPAWMNLLLECGRSMGVARPVRLLRSLDRSMPMAFETRRPAILIPSIADLWCEDRRRAVLLHELAHIARRDSFMQLMAAVTCAIYWPHPGVWWAARRLRVERELACDDCVLATGTHARDYAAHLLDLAYTLGGSRAPALTVSMARPRQIEGRILAALDNGRNRATPPRRSRLAGIAVAAALVVPLAAAEATRASAPNAPSVEPRTAAPPAVRIPATSTAAPAPAPPPSAATPATQRIELQTADQSKVVSQLPVVAPSYVIQPGDVLTVLIWHNKDLSGDVVVRPDGMITMPLLNDLQAAGLKPEQLAANLRKALVHFQDDPNVTVVVKQVSTRFVYITGAVMHPGAYTLTEHLTVVQLITIAGGISASYGDLQHIVIIRVEHGEAVSLYVNYDELRKGLNIKENNIELQPGDQIIVP